MEWDNDAADEFVKMPIAKSAKENTKVFAEKLARKSLSGRVTLKEVEAAKKVTYDSVSEEKRQRELGKRVAEGETDLRQVLEKEGREILSREIDLFNIELCHAQFFRCRSQIIELRELKKEVEQKLRELEVSQMIADSLPDDERIMAHHRLTVSISGCPNGCTGPETRPFGVHGVSRPMITEVTCSECFECVERCRRGAIVIREGGPVINTTLCDLCENCIKVCPTGKLVSEKKGYRIMVGGKFGRFHQVGTQLFRIADKETLMAALEASVRAVKEEAVGHEDITSIVNRVGVAPIFQRLYRSNGNMTKNTTRKVIGMTRNLPQKTTGCEKCCD